MITPKVETCSCGASIVWAQNPETRRWSPFDARPERLYILNPGEDGVLRWQSQSVYRSHWSTCPQADKFRRDRSTTREPAADPAPPRRDLE